MTQISTQGQRSEETGYEDGAPDELGSLLAKEISLGPAPIVEALNRSEMQIQMQAARQNPRSLKDFTNHATTMATLSQGVAASCMYALPRRAQDGTIKAITGPSIRMAEIVASAWGNIRVDCRIVEVGEDSVVARGMCIDLESNNGQSVEVRQSIRDRKGNRYNQDMIGVTAMSAIARARRNAIFSVIPRGVIIPVLDTVRNVAMGSQQTLGVRREEMLKYFLTLGISEARVLASVGVSGVADVDLERLMTLRGYAEAIKTGEASIDVVFPEDGPKSSDPLSAKIAAAAEARKKAEAEAEAAKAAKAAPKVPESRGPGPDAKAASKPQEEAKTPTTAQDPPPASDDGQEFLASLGTGAVVTPNAAEPTAGKRGKGQRRFDSPPDILE